jgi:hypothetical protein
MMKKLEGKLLVAVRSIHGNPSLSLKASASFVCRPPLCATRSARLSTPGVWDGEEDERPDSECNA